MKRAGRKGNGKIVRVVFKYVVLSSRYWKAVLLKIGNYSDMQNDNALDTKVRFRCN